MTIPWINIVILIGLTTLTGSILMLVWYGIGLVLERLGFINIVFELLKMVALFFYLPIAFVGLKIYITQSGVGQLFSPTPSIVKTCRFIVIMWLIGAVIAMGVVVYNFIWMFVSDRKLFECTQEQQLLFEQLKAELGMEQTGLQLRQSYESTTPYVEGLPTPKIVLPVVDYTPDQLRVILIHEMTHYKQKDLSLKLFTYVLLIFHYFNPFAWILIAKIRKWSEFACDYRASVYVGGIKPYFNTILNIMIPNPLTSGLTSHMAVSQHELRERVEKLVRINKMKKRTGLSAILVICAAFMCSSVTTYAATVKCAETYMEVEAKTEVADAVASVIVDEPLYITEDIVSDTNLSYSDLTMEYGDDHRVNCMEGEIAETNRGGSLFEWDLPIGCRIYGPYFECTTGTEIVVTAVFDPLYVTIRVGLEDELGYRYYAEGSDNLAFRFTIPNDRRYRIYVQNDTHTEASVSGSYITR